MSEVVDHAKLPDYTEILEQLELGKLTEANHVKAMEMNLKFSPPPACKDCTGDLTIGFFFDGTDNNKDRDWGPDDKNPLPFMEQKHTNIVRLFHAFPDEDDGMENRVTLNTTNRCYRYYIPGVGTRFDEIKDNGTGPLSIAGTAAGWGGEARIYWALFQVINAVWRFYDKEPKISDGTVQAEIRNIKTGMSDEAATNQRMLENMATVLPGAFGVSLTARRLQRPIHKDERRVEILRKEIEKLKMRKGQIPKLRQITVHVFGFSRGAAEARAFVKYLLELGDQSGRIKSGRIRMDSEPDGIEIAGIPLRIQFMGLFDTVASVGMAGMYSITEGHAAWADGTMEIPHYKVGECVHLVAGHETRACFPLDSVRVKGKYTKNVHEIVYPGSHSDLGGGYSLRSLGKDDYGGRPITTLNEGEEPGSKPSEETDNDLQIARVPCFDMYCRALAAGVPFYTLEQLEAQGTIGRKYAKDLKPQPNIVRKLLEYKEASGIKDGSVEDQSWKNFGLYLGWRWEQGRNYYASQKSIERDIFSIDERLATLNTQLTINKSKQKAKGALRGGGSLNKLTLDEDGKFVPNAEWKALLDEEAEFLRQKQRAENDKAVLEKELADAKNGKIKPGVEIQRALQHDKTDEAGYLEDTQRALLVVSAHYCYEINKRVRNLEADKDLKNIEDHLMPLINPLSPLGDEAYAIRKAQQAAARAAILKAAQEVANEQGKKIIKRGGGVMFLATVTSYLLHRYRLSSFDIYTLSQLARQVPNKLERWMKALKDAGVPPQHDELSPEREGLWLLEAIDRWCKLSKEKRDKLGDFFASDVHDSMAGFIGKTVWEFELNGYGMAKFRRIFFGNTGDLHLCARIIEDNESRRNNLLRSPHAAAATPPSADRAA